jgi:hypothetical protein
LLGEGSQHRGFSRRQEVRTKVNQDWIAALSCCQCSRVEWLLHSKETSFRSRTMKRGGIQIKHQNGTAVQVKYQYWTVTAVLTSWHTY